MQLAGPCKLAIRANEEQNYVIASVVMIDSEEECFVLSTFNLSFGDEYRKTHYKSWLDNVAEIFRLWCEEVGGAKVVITTTPAHRPEDN